MSANDVLEQALGLSDIERLNLAEQLMESVDHEPSADEEFDLDPSYSTELQRRLDEMARGAGVSHDAWESLERIRRKIEGTPVA
jgi:putative addiction module component (TIGR02574 family)